MKLESAPAGRTRPARRGPEVRAAILAATLAELTEKGYAALTVDNVARRSGVHKTTIYRRWKDREALVADAFTNLLATRGAPIAGTGNIDADLRDLARSLVRWLTSPTGKGVLAAMTSDAARIPEIADVKYRFFESYFQRAEPVISAAIARGEIPAATDPRELVRTVIAPIHLRFLITAEPIDETTADNAAKVALVAARAGALSLPSA
jgi:AcrR family transcriptional regulator